MKFDYRETTNDLAIRIDIHNQYGGRNIDAWMLDLLALQPGIDILDIGCGAGKQCFSYYDHLNGKANISGGDVNQELLDQARQEAVKRAAPISFFDLDFNKHFDLPDDAYDLVSCCFAIYYADNVPFTIGEMKRVLKPGGRLFTTGPMPENKKLFYDIIREATDNRPIPPMPGSSRYSSEFLDVIKKEFPKVEVHIFENPLVFDAAEPFVSYVRASLSEDRKLWSTFFQSKDEFQQIMEKIEQAATRRIAQDGKLVMTKVVGGFLGTK
ncbi:MAG: methyltransferase domain-containing protein [Anaerolineae bacterium]|jgi:ubiquinone/menaquinone biosynthesis C-methylase UbiE|nr:methyltransferase domain-containing protein [Anaerolineae bacterium]